MDSLVLLTVLAGAVVILFYLLRRDQKAEQPAPFREEPPRASIAPPPAATSQQLPELMSYGASRPMVLQPLPQPSLTPPHIPVPSVPRKRKKKRAAAPKSAGSAKSAAKPASEGTTMSPTPVTAVLEMLQNPATLITAFLLREILDAPRSRRR